MSTTTCIFFPELEQSVFFALRLAQSREKPFFSNPAGFWPRHERRKKNNKRETNTGAKKKKRER